MLLQITVRDGEVVKSRLKYSLWPLCHRSCILLWNRSLYRRLEI